MKGQTEEEEVGVYTKLAIENPDAEANVFAKLVPEIQQAIFESGYEKPTPIQAQSIPHLLEQRDILGCAQTGTGKTAAFTLPIMNYLVTNRKRTLSRRPRVLILAPTRELATQIGDQVMKYGKYCGLWHTCVYGGVSQFHQVRALREGVDVIVATPGRLLDLMNQRALSLDSVESFVLDEADRMLDMGFIPDIKKVIAELPAERWNLFFSATLKREVMNLANTLVTNPVEVTIDPEMPTVDRINQKIMYIDHNRRNALLTHLLKERESAKCIVFSRTKAGTERIAGAVEDAGITAVSIHGDKTQKMRDDAINMFKRGRRRVLVATDVAARGLDIDGVTLVVNYDLPQPGDAEAYVHRIGRTARAGTTGDAISFVTAEDGDSLRMIERFIKKSIPADVDHMYHSENALQGSTRHGGARGGRGRGYGGYSRGFGGRDNRGFGGRGGSFNRGPPRGRGGPMRGGFRDRGPPRRDSYGRD